MSESTALAVQETALAVQEKQLAAIRQILSQKTPEKEIRWRKGRGKDQFKYTDGAYIIRTLNEALGHNWDFEADNEEIINWNGQPFEVRCRGRLTLRLGGIAVTKVQYGSQAIEFIKERDAQGKVYIVAPVSIGDCFKGAATDAMKKCASLFGLALDLYDSDYKAENYEQPDTVVWPENPPETPVKKKAAEDKYQGVITDTGPSKKLMQDRKHSPEVAARFDAVVAKLTGLKIRGDELLRETNSVLHDAGLKQVKSRYELDDNGATMVCQIFEKWADRLAREQAIDAQTV